MLQKSKTRFSLIFNCILWFYRIIGFPFGGIAFDSSGRLYIKKAFVIYDNCLRLLLPVLALILSIVILESSRFKSLHHGINDVVFYAFLLYILLSILTLLNTNWFIGRGGEAFVKCLGVLGTHVTVSIKVLLAFWIIHLFIPILFVAVGTYQSDMFDNESTIMALIYIWSSKFIFFYQFWITTFVTFFVSQQCQIRLTRIMSDLKGFHLTEHGKSKPSRS